jgi:cell wall-associated NlpC family hydrolase
MIWTPERQKAADAEMLSWLGTEHQNCIAIRGVGIDCIQLVYRAMIAAGILPEHHIESYSTSLGLFHESDHLEEALLAMLYADKLAVEEATWGDVAVFKTGENSAHCGFLALPNVWQSLAHRTVTMNAWSQWRHRAKCVIRVTGEGFREQPDSVIRRMKVIA